VIPVAGAFSSASPAVPVDGGGPPDASGPSDGSVESAADGTGGVAPLVSTKLPVAGNATTQAIAVAFDRSGELLVQTREPATLWVLDASRSAWKAITLSTTSRKDTGHDVFHSVAGALIACASCHPEGGDDSHVWLLDGQTRRTPSLRGTIAGTAPYHWLGDEPTLNVLANDVYTGRMNGVSLDTSQLAALESWVEAIPAPPAPTWVDSAAAKRGQTIFVSETAACSKCHSGPKFTNNATTDVGTGGAFQVPPLVGVGWRTPLLHIGCGTTVADRFGGCATTGHGNTAGLSASQLSDLTAYLDSL